MLRGERELGKRGSHRLRPEHGSGGRRGRTARIAKGFGVVGNLERPGIRSPRRMRRRDHPRWPAIGHRSAIAGRLRCPSPRCGSAGPRRPRELGSRCCLHRYRLGPSRCPRGYPHMRGGRYDRIGGRCRDSGRGRSPGQERRPGLGHIRAGGLQRGCARPGSGRRLLRAGLRRMCMPHARGHQDLVLLREGRHPAPSPRFGHVPDLRGDQLGQSLTLDDRSGRQPSEDSGRQYVKPHEGVVERQADSNKEDHIGNRYPDEHADPGDRQRSWQPKIV